MNLGCFFPEFRSMVLIPGYDDGRNQPGTVAEL